MKIFNRNKKEEGYSEYENTKYDIEMKVSMLALKYEDERNSKGLLPKEFWREVKLYIFKLYFKVGIFWSVLFLLLSSCLLYTKNFSAFFFWLIAYFIYLGYLYMKTISWTKSVKKNGIKELEKEGKSGGDLL